MRYIEVSGKQTCMTDKDYPDRLEARMKLFLFFKHLLLKNWTIQVVDDQMKGVVKARTKIPHLHTWFKTEEASFFHLTNGTVQVSDEISSHVMNFIFKYIVQIAYFFAGKL